VPLPLDLTEIAASVERTGRLIVLHEGRRTHGFGAEVVASIVEGCRKALKAVPSGSRPWTCPSFCPELEAAYRPTKDRVVQLITAWMP